MVTFEERLAMEAKNVSHYIYQMTNSHPERGATIFKVVEGELPELWEPLTVLDSYNSGGVLEVVAEDAKGHEHNLSPGEWVDRDIAAKLWGTVIPFTIESPRGRNTYVVANDNTMVYVPKCKTAIDTGLPDGSVMNSITGRDGSLRYTKCPFGVNNSSECEYPRCLSQMVTKPQPSIKAAKAAFRNAACVCIATDRGRSRMLFLTNGPNHLNLVTLPQAIASAWFSDYVQGVADVIEAEGLWEDIFDESSEEQVKALLEERRLALIGEERLRLQESEEIYAMPDSVEKILEAEEMDLPENIRIVRKKPKVKLSTEVEEDEEPELSVEESEQRVEQIQSLIDLNKEEAEIEVDEEPEEVSIEAEEETEEDSE